MEWKESIGDNKECEGNVKMLASDVLDENFYTISFKQPIFF